MELQRPNFTNFDVFFCKKSMSRWIRGKNLFGGPKFHFFGGQGDLFRRLRHFSSEGVPISREGVPPLLDHILLTTTIKWYYRINDLLFLLQFNHHPWFWSFEGNWCICCDWHHPPNSVYKNWLFSALGSPINEVKKRKMFTISLRIHLAAFPTAG